MAISGLLFLSWRFVEFIVVTPIVGMLAWFVHQYVKSNLLTPDYILVLFITSVLALAWVLFTVLSYIRARHDALFVAAIDLGFVGAFIAGVVVMRFIAHSNCGSFGGAGITTSGSYFHYSLNKACAMLKASFALGIIAAILFFITFLLALLVHRNHRDDDRVVVKRTHYHDSRHGHRRSHSQGRSYSQGRRSSSRGYDSRPRSSGRGGSRYDSRRAYV